MWSLLHLAIAISALAAAAWGSAPAGAQDLPGQKEWMVSPAMNFGAQVVRPDAWGMAKTELKNPTAQSADLLLSLHFDVDPGLRFISPVSLPPHSRRRIHTPMRLVSGRREGEVGVGVTALLLEPDTGRLRTTPGEGRLIVEEGRPTLSLMSDLDDQEGREVVLAMRMAGDLGPRVGYLAPQNVPANDLGLGTLDGLVISHPHPPLDPAQRAALTRWVLQGGHLWIMAEQVDHQFARALLNNLWNLQAIDHVQLNEFTLMRGETGDGNRPLGRGYPVSLEEPVRMVRVLAPGWQVIHTVNGHPASLMRRVGRGLVLVTTVGPRAWYEKIDRDVRPRDLLVDLAQVFGDQAGASPLPERVFADGVRQRVGYQIISRGVVLSILSLFCAALLAAGLWLNALGRLEHLAWVAVLLALAATVSLVSLGLAGRRQSPLTVVDVQFIELAPAAHRAVVSGALGVYSPEELRTELRGSRGGMAWPEVQPHAGAQYRLRWSDLDRWQWQDLRLSSGSTLIAPMQAVLDLPRPTFATARFEDQGLRVEFGGAMGWGDLSDVVLATPYGHMAARPWGEGAWLGDRTLGPGEYYTGGVLNEVQQRRQALLRQLLEESRGSPNAIQGSRSRYPREPMLLAWVRPVDLQVELPKPHAQEGTAILAAPLTLQPSEPGAMVRVPAPFVPVQVLRGNVFNPLTGQWIGDAPPQSVTVVARFQLPPQVLPLKVRSALWSIRLSAPGRILQAHRGADSDSPPLATARDRLQGWSVELNDQVQPDELGGLTLTLVVGPAGDAVSSWRMDGMSLEVTGQVLHPPQAATARERTFPDQP